MRKIVVLQHLPQYKEMLEAAAPGWDIVFTKDAQMARQQVEDAEIIVGWSSVAEEQLENNQQLRWVQATSAGVDNIPMDLLQKRGILLTSASGVHPRPVSESVFASMLALARSIPPSVRAQQEEKWIRGELNSQMSEIHGKVLGVLGTGHIGQQIARIGRAFSMRTLGLQRTTQPAPYFDSLYPTHRLYDLLARCDYVVNILPLTPDTRKMMNQEAFAAMRPGSRYFAFGRGEITDTDALVAALESGHIEAAGLDVVHPEPLPPGHPLWQMDNVLITPHVAGLTPVYFDRVMEIFKENLAAYVSDQPLPRNLIDLKEQY